MHVEKVDTIYQGVSCVMTLVNDTFFIKGDKILITRSGTDGDEEEIEIVGELDTSPSDVITHRHNFRCCNICQEAEIYEDNTNGVCGMCADNRVEDGMWTEDLRHNEDLRTYDNGDIKINSSGVYKIVGETSAEELLAVIENAKKEDYYIVQYNDCYDGGRNKSFEGVMTQEGFNKWLKRHNEVRVSEGNIEEGEEEFDLISTNIIR